TQGRGPASGSLDSRVRGNDEREEIPRSHTWLPDQPALLLFTSGTGGAPKAVCHGLCGIQHSAQVTAAALDLAPGDRWLLTLPLHHVSGLSIMIRCLAAGAACFLSNRETPLAEQLLRHAPTHLSLVATQLRRLLEVPESREPLSRLKTLLLGGGPTPVELLHRALDAGIPVRNSYGMTETFALVCLSRRNAPPAETASAGLPLEPDTVFITEDDHIALRGPRLFLGYWRNGALDPSRTPNGAFLTNDTGRMDPQARLTVTGRTDTMFISGGENIHPEEIEAALLRLPEILAALVVPVAHPEFGAVPAAFLQTAEGVLPELAALREELARMLPRHALPRHLLPWPGTESAGIKADRSQWRKKAESALGISNSETR
ncbi:MAG: AMP-binding protein, partial [Candidatus Hydrogenedens sp.]|nr:AMP-binding protein [Candidatus Hydrogenedens sp.]